MSRTELDGSIPNRLYFSGERLMVDWCYLGDFRLTDPFFGDSLRRAFRHPFRVLFRHQTPADLLIERAATHPGIGPTGFIFHMSRCGSTLVARMLAASDRNVVVSEAEPVQSALYAEKMDPAIGDNERVALFRGIGTNEFHGSALNANTFFNNLNALPRNILIRNELGARVGGPIRKNQTFFHFLFESSRIRQNSTSTRTVYTDTARKGLFRYFPGAQNANASSATASRRARQPAETGRGHWRPANGISLRPRPQSTRCRPDRNHRQVPGPQPAAQCLPDWRRTEHCRLRLQGLDARRSYPVRLSHRSFLYPRQRISVTYNHENESNPNGFMATLFPGVPGGDVISRTRVLSVNLTSTLTPSGSLLRIRE